MKSFADNVDASMQQLRTILASGLKQFKSSLSKSENAKLSEEIVNAITSNIKEYLVNIHNVTIDQISGRFETKFQDAKFAISEDSLEQIKEILQQINAPVQETKTAEKTTVVETTTVVEKESEENSETSKEATEAPEENTKTNDIMNWLSSLGLLEKLDELKIFFQENIVQEEPEETNKDDEKDDEKNNEEKQQESFLSKLFGFKKVPKWFNKKFLVNLIFDVQYINKFVTRLNKRLTRVIRPILTLDRQLLALNIALIASGKLLYSSKMTLALSNITLAISNIFLATANIIYAAAIIILAISYIILAASTIILAVAKFILAVVSLSFALLVLTVLTAFLLFVISMTIMLITVILSLVMTIVLALLSITVSLILSLSMFILTTLITAISLTVTLLLVATIFIVSVLAIMLIIIAAALIIFLAITAITMLAVAIIATVLIVAALAIALILILAATILFVATAVLAIALIAAGAVLLMAAVLLVFIVTALSVAIIIAALFLSFGLATVFIALTAVTSIIAGTFILLAIAAFALGFAIILEGVWLLISVVLTAIAVAIAAVAASILILSVLISSIILYVIIGILLLFGGIYFGFSGIWDKIKDVIFGFYNKFITPIFDKMKLIYEKYFTQLFKIFSPEQPDFSGVMSYFSKFGDLFKNLMEAFNIDISNFTFAGMFKNIWEAVKPGIKGAFVRSELFKQLVGKFALGLLNAILSVLDVIKLLCNDLGISKNFPFITEKIDSFYSKVVSVKQSILTFTKEAEEENKKLDKQFKKKDSVQLPISENIENIKQETSTGGTEQLRESTESTIKNSAKRQNEQKIEDSKANLDDGVLESLEGLEAHIDNTPTAVVPMPSKNSNNNLAANG